MTYSEPTSRSSALLLLAFVWLFSSGFLWTNLHRGWVPHDEGILAQAAERILHGEIPHRDFDDPYTGGLSYLNAAAFKLFGTNLFSLRIILFLFFLIWVPAVFTIAREFAGPVTSALTTLATVAWSVPNYPAAIPSWYCLFFATFGTLALLKYIRTHHNSWLVIAGLCGGLSLLMKTPGLFYVAGALLYFVYREQEPPREKTTSRKNAYAYLFFLALCLAAFVTLLCKLVLAHGSAREFIQFVYPALALVSLLLLRECSPQGLASRTRFAHLLSLLIPFLLGLLIPIILFLVPYLLVGSTRKLIQDLFVLHLRRISEATWPSPNTRFLFLPLLATFLIIQVSRTRGRIRIYASLPLIALSLLLLITSRSISASYNLIFEAIRNLIPVVATIALFVLGTRRKVPAVADISNQQIALLACIAVMCGLVQFPFPYPIYFCYVAPLVFLCALALLKSLPSPPRLLLHTMAATAILFAVFVLRPAGVDDLGFQYLPDRQTVALSIPRAGGLRVLKSSADQYDQLIPYVAQIANGQAILAGPDSPEIYFLAGVPNPTPVFFDFFHNTGEYRALMQGVLDRPGYIHVVVLKSKPQFSFVQRDILYSLVAGRFSHSRAFDGFVVFWR